jgi:DnaJ-domain-containing protein 1
MERLARLLLTAALGYVAVKVVEELLGDEPAAPDPDDPHEVLGVAPGAGADEVRRAWLRLVRLHHPDRFAHAGPDAQREAEERTQRLNAAYERLRRSFA